jgi:hypothetical protein
VVGWSAINKIRFLARFEGEFDILKECGLVPFDGEMIMSFALLDQICRDFALG